MMRRVQNQFNPERARSPRRATNGFTLLELVIAVSVLAIALTGLVTTMYRSSQVNESFEKRSVALKGAQKMMSKIQSQSRGNDGQDLKDYIEDIDGNSSDTINEFDVEDLEPDNLAEGVVLYTDHGGYIEVNVSVEWDDRMGEQEVVVTSYIFTYDKS